MIAALAAVTLTSVPALAQQSPAQASHDYHHQVRDAQKDYRHDMRNADSPHDVAKANQDYRHDMRDAQKDYRRDMRNWRTYRNYDWNRLPPGQRTYYADRYYRDGRYYRPRRLTRHDRIYRGYDGRYYCRRSDGTTGLILGGATGALFGSAISNGGSRTLGALIGGATGAFLGHQIDRGHVTCR